MKNINSFIEYVYMCYYFSAYIKGNFRVRKFNSAVLKLI